MTKAINLNKEAILTTTPDFKVSERYSFIPTHKIISAMTNVGFQPVKFIGNTSKGKHTVRFRHVEAKPSVGDCIPEIVVTNSHNGTSSLILELGLFRLVCSNGLVVSAGSTKAYKFRHVGIRTDDIIEKAFELTKADISIIQEMQRRGLTSEEKYNFCLQALAVRSGIKDTEVLIQEVFNRYAHVTEVIRPYRNEDWNSTLWNVFNRAQENIIKGRICLRDDNTWRGYRKARPITGVRQTEINRELWDLAVSYLN